MLTCWEGILNISAELMITKTVVSIQYRYVSVCHMGR